jgi:cobalt-zinc-cadmium efflux system membrane fusion protein
MRSSIAIAIALSLPAALCLAESPPPPRAASDAITVAPTTAKDQVRSLHFGEFTALFEKTSLEEIRARLGDQVRTGQVLAVLESNSTLASFSVSSPIHGTVVDFHITMGESVEAGRYLFIVADLTEVWVDLDIFQKDLGRVEKGQSVSVVAGRDELSAGGTIDYVGPVVREDTRTGLARVTLANPDGKWKAGMFVTCQVTTDTPSVPVAIRRSATQKIEGRTVAFVWTDDGFEPRDLTLGRHDTEFVEVLSGIEPGERYVSERSFLLKSHLEKSAIDPHSGHNH